MCTLLPDALERQREKDQVQGQSELHSLSQKSYATSNTSILNVTGAGQMAGLKTLDGLPQDPSSVLSIYCV